MNILVIGSGGREHTLVWRLARSTRVKRMYAAPGNGGISRIAECVSIPPHELLQLAGFAQKHQIDLTVVGPEVPLVEGIVDLFHERGLRIFGPSKGAALLEGSKVFAKELMARCNIPTAHCEVFDDIGMALGFLRSRKTPFVIKAEGLAAGKGVIIAETIDAGEQALKSIMEERVFGDAGTRVVIEDYIEGEEASILAFSDGKTVIPMIPSQDHKRVFDRDEGPNTGGMGAYAPAPVVREDMVPEITRRVLQPVIDGLAGEGTPYKGILYAGLMITDAGPLVLEFNVRFGDPEAQVVIPLLMTDLVDVLDACIDGRLDRMFLEWSDESAVCVVMASGGYPGAYEKGHEIHGLDDAASGDGIVVFHAGTRQEDGRCVTSGGRVLGVTARDRDIPRAIERAYQAVKKISFSGAHYRKDIGRKALDALSGFSNSKP